jgi:hypothetical protein
MNITTQKASLDQAEFDNLTARSEATITAKILADSLHPNGKRLTTVELTYPRCIHSEFMTHREFSRNAASSRAIPMQKMLAQIMNNPFFPLHWGKNQKGMQASEELGAEQKLRAGAAWMAARTGAVMEAEELDAIGIHKQIGNRITEPWMWITVIASATNFENFFALRCHPAAEPHIQNLAYKLRTAYDASQPKQLQLGDWHLPLVGLPGDETLVAEFSPMEMAKISTGRCARVSYLTHEGVRNPMEDIRLFGQLTSSVPLHASPLEHPALLINDSKHTNWGNFAPGFLQLRKMQYNECVTIRST